MSKETLAIKSVRMMPKDSQMWLNVGFNMSEDRLKILYQGFDVEKLPLKVITETRSSSYG